MAKPSAKKPALRAERSAVSSYKKGAHRSAATGRFLSRAEDVDEFAVAARAYTKEHTRTRAAALKALRDMGMITASGNLSKRYR